MDPTLLAVAIVALLAVALAASAQVRLARVRRDFRVLWGDGAGTAKDVARLAADQQRRLIALNRDVDGLHAEVAAVRADAGRALRHVAVIRYDAFGDMGGRLSFSCAVVDDDGDGLVLSSIHGRGESRTYAKGVVGGTSAVTLSPEEQEALAAARADPPRAARGRPTPPQRESA